MEGERFFAGVADEFMRRLDARVEGLPHRPGRTAKRLAPPSHSNAGLETDEVHLRPTVKMGRHDGTGFDDVCRVSSGGSLSRHSDAPTAGAQVPRLGRRGAGKTAGVSGYEWHEDASRKPRLRLASSFSRSWNSRGVREECLSRSGRQRNLARDRQRGTRKEDFLRRRGSSGRLRWSLCVPAFVKGEESYPIAYASTLSSARSALVACAPASAGTGTTRTRNGRSPGTSRRG